MRKVRADQCKAIGCAGTDSVGYRDDGLKLAGSGPSTDKHGIYYPGSPLGDAQVRSGKFLGIPYPKGGVLDRVHEAFAGPHDFLNYAAGLYTDAGYWAGNVTHGYSLFWEGVNVGLAAPIVAGSAVAPISPAVVGAGAIDDYD